MATKIKLLTTLAALLIAAAGVMTFEACKNNKSINPLSTADLAKTAPIASKSLLTGGMHYYIDVDKLQKGINSYFENRSDNIVVQSFEIVEADSTEYNKNGLRFTTIDIDNETSTTTLLYDDFIRIETINDSVYYYIDTDVADGSYSFIFFADDSGYLFHVDNNKLTDMELINDSVPCFASGKWVISCTGHNCFVGTCVPLDQEVALGCSPCHITDEQHWCETHISGSGGGDTPWLGIISIILGIIGIIVAL